MLVVATKVVQTVTTVNTNDSDEKIMNINKIIMTLIGHWNSSP